MPEYDWKKLDEIAVLFFEIMAVRDEDEPDEINYPATLKRCRNFVLNTPQLIQLVTN